MSATATSDDTDFRGTSATIQRWKDQGGGYVLIRSRSVDLWGLLDPSTARGRRKSFSRWKKSARILARQIARAEHHIRARPLLRNGKAWRS